jgi:hypothetical protein
MFLNWGTAKLGLEIWAVNLICGLLFSWGLIRFALAQPSPWLAVTVAVPYLIIVVAMGYARQAVAIGIIFAALADPRRRSLLRLAVFVAIAAAFHKSAVIILPIVALASVRNKLLTYLMMGATALLLYYLFVQDTIDTVMVNYVAAGYSSQGAAIRIAMNLPPAMLLLAFRSRFNLPKQDWALWRNFSIASLIALVMLIVSPSSTAVDRISLYLIPLQIFVLARVPYAFKEQGNINRQLTLLVLSYSALVQWVWLNYADHSSYWLPYRVYPFD